MKVDRREFLSLGAFASLGGWLGLSSEVGKPYPGWKPGEMDLHFIYTGVGENMFYMLPDGTTWLNDTGDHYRPNELHLIPRLPSARLLGGEYVARYIRRLTDARHIDYMTLSHWHTDHMGNPDLRARTRPDGRRVCGLALVGEHFTFGHYLDHQHDQAGEYDSADVGGMKMMRDFVAREQARYGLRRERFEVGALNQIKLQHDAAGQYADCFSVRNLCANGVIWTGEGMKTRDLACEHVRKTGQKTLNQNSLSMALVMRYGKFSFYTGGDVSRYFTGADGRKVDYERMVGAMAGPVTVAKANHHGTLDAMRKEFVEQVRAKLYVHNVWCPRHLVDCNLKWESSRELYPGDRAIAATFIPEEPHIRWPEAAWWKDMLPGGHVVVKVAPGGAAFKTYVLDPRDEELRVIDVQEFES